MASGSRLAWFSAPASRASAGNKTIGETIGYQPTVRPGDNDVVSYRRAGGVPDSNHLRSIFECLR